MLAFLWMHGPAGAFAAEANEKEASLGSHGPLLVLAEPIFAWRSEARNGKLSSLVDTLDLQLQREPRRKRIFFIPIARNPLKSPDSEK